MLPLAAAGSNRRYFRLEGPVNLIGTFNECREENEAFIYLAKHFRNSGIRVPEIAGVSDDRLAYLQEDLGNTSLFDAIKNGRETRAFSADEIDLLIKTIRRLPDLQFKGAQGLDFAKCYPPVEFNRRTILWDLNYFKYCFLKIAGIDFMEDRLEDDFCALAGILEKTDSDTFMYRDFQSRNVMIRDGEPWFIDFQGGRKGPCLYDAVSFIWQAKANMPSDLRKMLAEEYLCSMRRYRQIGTDEYFKMLRHFVLFRTLQVLGAYGYRGLYERKPHFMQSIPYALANLRELLDEPSAEYPYLASLLREVASIERFAMPVQNGGEDKTLTVKVASFSYKKGIPEDKSGNGGGFVFDCRAVHNPGRYEQYKPLTGLDAPVIEFLESNSEMPEFMESCYSLVDHAVETYMRRGFTSLMVSFGCTGGRHRSVYGAQHMAEHIHKKYGVRVVLTHREQGIRRTYESA